MHNSCLEEEIKTISDRVGSNLDPTISALLSLVHRMKLLIENMEDLLDRYNIKYTYTKAEAMRILARGEELIQIY